MPAWADVFSLQERWDLVIYLYSVQPGAAGPCAQPGILEDDVDHPPENPEP